MYSTQVIYPEQLDKYQKQYSFVIPKIWRVPISKLKLVSASETFNIPMDTNNIYPDRVYFYIGYELRPMQIIDGFLWSDKNSAPLFLNHVDDSKFKIVIEYNDQQNNVPVLHAMFNEYPQVKPDSFIKTFIPNINSELIYKNGKVSFGKTYFMHENDIHHDKSYWESIEIVESSSRFEFIAVGLGLLILGGFGILTWNYSNREK